MCLPRSCECLRLARAPERRDHHQVPPARNVPAEIKAATEPTVVQILTSRFDTFWQRSSQECDISFPNLPMIFRPNLTLILGRNPTAMCKA